MSLLLSTLLFAGCAAGRRGEAGPGVDSAGRLTRAPAVSPESVSRLLTEQYGEWEGVAYRSGGMSKGGVDCSGFVYLTFRDRLGVALPRTTKQQSRIGRAVPRKRLSPGDLVFFKTGLFKRHVGIYTDRGRFIHASTSRGVTRSSLSDRYWSRTFWQARRVLPF